MEIGIVSLFPPLFDALNYGIVYRAQENHLLTINIWNPRDFTQDKHQTVDDRPYGGGPGMVMKVQPLQSAILTAKQSLTSAKVIYLSPQGQRFSQTTAQRWSQQQQLILVAGRYEGIDERLLESVIDEECSIGDYILSGGELAALVIIDTITRLLRGALGDATSAHQDSFSCGLLEYPQYTRPEVVNGKPVPEILLSGDHQAIARWRLKQALGRTWLKRPDLLVQLQLTDEQQALLNEFIDENRGN